ncbi:MAG: hypothetical protein JWP89_6337 [Schlesneria sp.]|nr:hypothetical protein [Schlesneria sp.]
MNLVNRGPDRSVVIQVSVVARPGVPELKFAIACCPGLCLTPSQMVLFSAPGGTGGGFELPVSYRCGKEFRTLANARS